MHYCIGFKLVASRYSPWCEAVELTLQRDMSTNLPHTPFDTWTKCDLDGKYVLFPFCADRKRGINSMEIRRVRRPYGYVRGSVGKWKRTEFSDTVIEAYWGERVLPHWSGIESRGTFCLLALVTFQRMDTGSAWLFSVGRKHIHIRHLEDDRQYKKGGICGEVVAVAIKESTTAYSRASNFESCT